MIAITITVYFLQVHTSYLWDPVRKVLDLTKVSSMRSDKNMTQCINQAVVSLKASAVTFPNCLDYLQVIFIISISM